MSIYVDPHTLGKLPHYDLTESRRKKAIELGAKTLSLRESVKSWQELRKQASRASELT